MQWSIKRSAARMLLRRLSLVYLSRAMSQWQPKDAKQFVAMARRRLKLLVLFFTAR